jgi:hypothetical protein
MPCSFCQNPQHNIRSCNSIQIRNICNRIKVFVADAISDNDYDEYTFMNNIRSFRLRDLKAACIHWRHFCDPEILDDFYIPEIRATLNYNTYIYIAMWLFIYVEHRHNETFLQHSSNPTHAYNGFWMMLRRRFWRNIGILNMNQNHAHTLYIDALDRISQITSRALSLVTREPRKFEFDINICHTAAADVAIVDECPICYDVLNIETNLRNQCGHSICIGCFEKYMDTMIPKTSDPCCSICRSVFKKIDIYSDAILPSIEKYMKT